MRVCFVSRRPRAVRHPIGLAVLAAARAPGDDGQLAQTALDEVRDAYTWHRAGRLITAVYEVVEAGTDFTMPGGPIDPCQFRQAPHLL